MDETETNFTRTDTFTSASCKFLMAASDSAKSLSSFFSETYIFCTISKSLW